MKNKGGDVDFRNHGYEPQGKLWTLIPPQGAGYYTPFIRDNSTNKLLRSLGLITLRLWRDCSTCKFQYTYSDPMVPFRVF
jgi:hypothetical protein